MPNNISFVSTLPSADIVRRFPGLRRAAALQQELVQDAYLELNEQIERGSGSFSGANDDVNAEALKFYNQIVKDGRFVSMLATEPGKVAELSGIRVSKEALGVIKEAGAAAIPGSEVQNPAIAPIAVAVAVAVVTKGSHFEEQIIIDQSGFVKF